MFSWQPKRKRRVKIKTLPPKLFDGGEGVDGSNRATPSGLFGLGGGVIEPEGPRILEGVRLPGDGGGGRLGGGGGVVVVEDLSFLEVVVVVVVLNPRVVGDLFVGDARFWGIFHNHLCSLFSWFVLISFSFFPKSLLFMTKWMH